MECFTVSNTLIYNRWTTRGQQHVNGEHTLLSLNENFEKVPYFHITYLMSGKYAYPGRLAAGVRPKARNQEVRTERVRTKKDSKKEAEVKQEQKLLDQLTVLNEQLKELLLGIYPDKVDRIYLGLSPKTK